MATYERLDYGSADGSHWGGAATDKLACYGETPVIQASAITAVNTTAASSSSPFGFTTSTQADAIVTAVNSLITAVKNFGITA